MGGFKYEFKHGINSTLFQLSHLTVMVSCPSGREELHLGGALYCSNLKILPLDERRSVAGTDRGTGGMEAAGTVVTPVKGSLHPAVPPRRSAPPWQRSTPAPRSHNSRAPGCRLPNAFGTYDEIGRHLVSPHQHQPWDCAPTASLWVTPS